MDKGDVAWGAIYIISCLLLIITTLTSYIDTDWAMFWGYFCGFSAGAFIALLWLVLCDNISVGWVDGS